MRGLGQRPNESPNERPGKKQSATGSALPDFDIMLAIANYFEVGIDNLILGSDDVSDKLADDKRLYSETIACTVKTRKDIPLLLEAYEEMREEDIADCIQTLGIAGPETFLTLCTKLTSGKICQVIKTLRLSAILPLVSGKMRSEDIFDCIRTLRISDAGVIKSIIGADQEC